MCFISAMIFILLGIDINSKAETTAITRGINISWQIYLFRALKKYGIFPAPKGRWITEFWGLLLILQPDQTDCYPSTLKGIYNLPKNLYEQLELKEESHEF